METESKGKDNVIDEKLYSRQLYVLGHDAMKKMAVSNVLVIGLRGLGVELAKDIILAGVKSVTLHDDHAVTLFDLSSQYYLSENDIGKPIAATCFEKLAELNSYVATSLHTGEVTEATISRHQVVVMANQPLEEMRRVNQICHSQNIAFVGLDTRGVFGSVFCDFGTQFEINDATGEPAQSVVITGITQENPGIVSVLDEQRIPFEDGDFVTFGEIQGMTQLNNSPARPIKILGPYTFSIEDTTGYTPYSGGGFAIQVKQTKTMAFLSLEESLTQPRFLETDFAKMERPPQLHLGFQALWDFHKRHQTLPEPHNEDHAKEVIQIATDINAKVKLVETIDDKLLRLLSFNAIGDLAPMNAFIAGVAAQEVLKACSGKFTPINQWLYYDATEVLPPADTPASEFQPRGSRYDAQIVVLGNTIQQKLEDLNVFTVGAGAIGCELLKLFAMMGIACGKKGNIHVTDMDIIEQSNLSRQFLFRGKDVEQPKSKTAAVAVKNMNPHINIHHYLSRVGPETESTFNETFYRGLDLVANALDNVEARMYMDSQCIYHKKPLLESGTLGTKGNTQVVVPFLTESYGSSRDPPEKSIPICTLHHFPNVIEHTIQWARDVFEGLYHNQAETVNSYLTNSTFFAGLEKQSSGSKIETLSTIKSCLVEDRPKTYEDCIQWARLKYEEYFNNNIQQLLFNFPTDMLTSNGAKFWSGPKRAPSPLTFNPNDETDMLFVSAAAALRAETFGIPVERDDADYLAQTVSQVKLPAFVPKKNVKIAATDAEVEANKTAPPPEDDDRIIERLTQEIPSPEKYDSFKMKAIDFEKDDDTNHHIDFITATANLRAKNYSITVADKHKVKGIAGKIIPAMVTTTAVVSGLDCLELLKVIQQKPLDQYKNGFVNLALPLFAFSEPLAPPKTKVRDDWSWNLWDRIEIDEGDITLQQVMDHIKNKYNLEVTMMSCSASIIYAFFMTKDKLQDRLHKKLTEVITSVNPKAIPPTKSSVVLEVCCNRLEDDEEADVPFVKYIFKH